MAVLLNSTIIFVHHFIKINKFFKDILDNLKYLTTFNLASRKKSMFNLIVDSIINKAITVNSFTMLGLHSYSFIKIVKTFLTVDKSDTTSHRSLKDIIIQTFSIS
jgi:hypothetical protein